MKRLARRLVLALTCLSASLPLQADPPEVPNVQASQSAGSLALVEKNGREQRQAFNNPSQLWVTEVTYSLNGNALILHIAGSLGVVYEISKTNDLEDWTAIDWIRMETVEPILYEIDLSENERAFFKIVPQFETPEGMVYISAGTFKMGDHWGVGWGFELPVHDVFVSSYFMDQYEVTKAHWDEVYDWAVENGYNFDSSGLGLSPKHPVTGVSWYDAVKWANARSEKEGRRPVYYVDNSLRDPYRQGAFDFTGGDGVDWNSKGYRLPTEAEWEKAARGGLEGHQYPWPSFGGNHEEFIDPGLAYYGDWENGSAAPVGSYAPNSYGLYDMAGNVWEWCWDWFGASYYSLAAESEDSPKGPNSGLVRVLRGGGWFHSAWSVRVAFRYGDTPLPRDSVLGFRLVSGLPQVE